MTNTSEEDFYVTFHDYKNLLEFDFGTKQPFVFIYDDNSKSECLTSRISRYSYELQPYAYVVLVDAVEQPVYFHKFVDAGNYEKPPYFASFTIEKGDIKIQEKVIDGNVDDVVCLLNKITK